MRVLCYLARHGTTDDSGKNIFRGQRNSALDKKGFKDAHELRQFFATKDWHRVFSSDLTRAVQTAKVIAQDRDGEVMAPVRGLRPWDIGEMTGKDKTKYAKEMQSYIDDPEKTIPGGESRRDFELERVHPLLIEAIAMGEKGKPPIVVAHSSLIHALSHLLYGPAHKDLAVKPGGVVMVYVDKDEIKAKVVLKAGHDDSSYAIARKSHPSS